MAVTVLKKGSLALAGLLLVAQAQATELLNSSYDVSRELFAALNPPFEQQWAKENNGDKLTIKQSHAGSSKQALAILQGLKADVVTYNQVTDVQILHDKGKLLRRTGRAVCRITAHRSTPPWVSWCVRATRKIFTTGTTWCVLT
jgi:sulfate transport system substrate-binding protein